ncbi:SpoIIIAH-like family protein [Ornithinibacillus contaminans]|uniref:SpoIIIAH-like family protein n=1 Tax=Ornithinibacillus contaminans TaxID=694055 RepID=UPI00064D8C19|nr:SpoIIIAH-like family protein [Ornithinibacillus contaminans]
MLKKQTVWLLTMLSLMIVLSVYYMTSNPNDFAYGDLGDNNETEPASGDTTNTDVDVNVTPGGDEVFATLRMELQDERGKKKERLETVVASSTASAEEKKQALAEMDTIDEITTKETILEESILASAEYQDVLVRHDDDIVHVHVIMVDDLSKTEVVNIMQLVRDEFGDIPVDVNYQPPTES